jgi:hypothetical protein
MNQLSFDYLRQSNNQPIQLIFPFLLSKSSIRRDHSKRQKTKLFGDDCFKYCCYCSKQLSFRQATVEHIIPISKGGPDKIENLTIACGSCNSSRMNYSFDVWKKIVSSVEGKLELKNLLNWKKNKYLNRDNHSCYVCRKSMKESEGIPICLDKNRLFCEKCLKEGKF